MDPNIQKTILLILTHLQFFQYFTSTLVNGLMTNEYIEQVEGKSRLTSRICNESSRFVKEVYESNKGIDMINLDALVKCTEVEIVNLGNNQIRQLDENIFEFNRKITMLYLYCNQLTVIPEKMLVPLKNLKELDIGANFLKTIEPVLQSSLLELESLSIMNNEVSNVNVESVRKAFPKLNQLQFAYNLLPCDTYEELMEDFKANRIITSSSPYSCGTYPSNACIKFNDMQSKYFKSQLDTILSNLNQTPPSKKTRQFYDSDFYERLDLKERIVELSNQVTILWWILGIFMVLMCILALIFGCKITNVKSEKQTKKPDRSEQKKTTLETDTDDTEYYYGNSYLAMQTMS